MESTKKKKKFYFAFSPVFETFTKKFESVSLHVLLENVLILIGYHL